MYTRELRISKKFRDLTKNENPLFLDIKNSIDVYIQAQKISSSYNNLDAKTQLLITKDIYSSAILHNCYQIVITRYLIDQDPSYFSRFVKTSENQKDCSSLIKFYDKNFPTFNPNILKNIKIARAEEATRGFFVHQVMSNNDALFKRIKPLLDLKFPQSRLAVSTLLGAYDQDKETLFDFLSKPSKIHPDSLEKQIQYIFDNWAHLLPLELLEMLKKSLTLLKEGYREPAMGFQKGLDLKSYSYTNAYNEYEAFTDDRAWMPNVVMMAKSTLVWLDQMEKKYKREIKRLDQIPDEELDYLAERGFSALWLIGLWQRSSASKKIKHLCGNPAAEASAYSLFDYDIADSIGGWPALNNLKYRCEKRGIRLASDMVPNHTGIDSNWMHNKPHLFVQQSWPAHPSYSFNGEDLSSSNDIEIKIDDKYYSQEDAAVTFRRVDKRTGETSYIFHGNDGTSMPWNDTAQIDFLKEEAREAVIEMIFKVASTFPIIRFDAAMTLAKKHIQRLWYPLSGTQSDIYGRALYAMSQEDFDRLIPKEFWREVVDRINKELPDTLLLAEAFWMMEGYFVRTLGMHRVYNSAFMHMSKNEDNRKYIEGMKNTLIFDPEILKRYVNFMNNPDEETAIAQFGDSDKYFGVCTLLATLPGLPMFGHGQIEGYYEKYGMEFSKAGWDEKENQGLIDNHYKIIFPLLKLRHLFSGVQFFELFDVHDNVYCYVNGNDNVKVLVLYNNAYDSASFTITNSVEKMHRIGENRIVKSQSLAQSLDLTLSGKHYIIYKNFSDGLFYIERSMKIFDEGLSFTLNGYERKVLLNIKEIEDYDGSLAHIYNKLNGKGCKDINLEINLLRLEELCIAASSFFSKEMQDLLYKALSKEGKVKDCNAYLLSCGLSYSKMAQSLDKLDLQFFSISINKAKTFLIRLQEITKTKHLSHLYTLMDELVALVHLSFFLRGFFCPEDSIESMWVKIDKLLLNHIFYDLLIKIEKDPSKHYSIIKKVPFLLFDFKLTGAKTAKGKLSKLLKNTDLQTYIDVNEYQGKTYYNQERLLDALSLVALNQLGRSRSESNEEIEDMYLNWLEKESTASYLFKNLS